MIFESGRGQKVIIAGLSWERLSQDELIRHWESSALVELRPLALKEAERVGLDQSV